MKRAASGFIAGLLVGVTTVLLAFRLRTVWQEEPTEDLQQRLGEKLADLEGIMRNPSQA